jgi:hypothetical protein
MKKIIIWNFIFLVVVFCISLCINGYSITMQYWLCDYIGYGLILTAQRMMKRKHPTAFLVYIVGLIFNVIFGVMNKSTIHVLFCMYSIGIFIDNWIEWNKTKIVN